MFGGSPGSKFSAIGVLVGVVVTLSSILVDETSAFVLPSSSSPLLSNSNNHQYKSSSALHSSPEPGPPPPLAAAAAAAEGGGGRGGGRRAFEADPQGYGLGMGYSERGGFGGGPMSRYERGGSMLIQGRSRGTFSNRYDFYNSRLDDPSVREQEVIMETDGRPLDAEFELWDGPNNTPTRMKVYSEDGYLRPFQASVATPPTSAGPNTMQIRNTGSMEFPIRASVEPGDARLREEERMIGTDRVLPNASNFGSAMRQSRGYSARTDKVIQGGSLKTFSFEGDVRAVQVTISTDGMPMYAVVELWGTGGHVKQIAEIYNDNGVSRPFTATVQTPGYANSICIRNTGPIAYPITATVDVIDRSPYVEDEEYGRYGRGPYGEYDSRGWDRDGYYWGSRGVPEGRGRYEDGFGYGPGGGGYRRSRTGGYGGPSPGNFRRRRY